MMNAIRTRADAAVRGRSAAVYDFPIGLIIAAVAAMIVLGFVRTRTSRNQPPRRVKPRWGGDKDDRPSLR